MTVQRILTVLLSLILMITIVLLGLSVVRGETLYTWTAIAGIIIFGGLLAIHLRGWRWSAHTLVILATLFTIAGNPAELTQRHVSFTVLAPVVIAAILLPWYWGIGAFIVSMIGIAVQTGGQGPLFGFDVMALATFTAIGVSFAGVVARNAQRIAEENAGRLAEALTKTEEQAHELVEANELLSEQLDQQSTLLDLVTTLETPVVPLAEGVLLAPIVGHVDTRRAEVLTKRLLQEASTQRARLVVLDIAGVSMVDTAVARALIQTVQALRLLGCDVVLSGISASVAMALIHLGVDLEKIRTVRSPQEALASYLSAPQRPTPGRALIQAKRGGTPSVNSNGHTNLN
ncbi:MAG: STAS domain-containing protein [Roseiflexaceae bacterium]